MTSNFRFQDSNNWPSGVDLDDVYLRKEYFAPGGLWTWGYNSDGELGDGTVVYKSSPVSVGGTNWKSISAGYEHNAAVKTDGTLWTWGYNVDGALGDNSVVTKSSPVQTVSGGTNWKSVSCGSSYHTAAIKTDGTLWTWGYNASGQLGDNSVASKSSPVQIVSGGTNWKSVSCGYNHITAIKTDGTLWIWGGNASGQLGDNSVASKSSPVQTVSGGTNWKQISAAKTYTTAIKTDGTLWVWGYGAYGVLGLNNPSTLTSSPVQTIAGGTDWKTTFAGNYTTMAIKTNGTLWACGYNPFGGLGNGTASNRSSPIQIGSLTTWKQVSCGYYHSIGLMY